MISAFSILLAVISLATILVALMVYLLTELGDSLAQKLDQEAEVTEYGYRLNEQHNYVRQLRKVILYVAPILLTGVLIYYFVKDTSMEAFVMEWLNLLVRWAHVVVGIMWIGASFYFIFLENNLNRTEDVRDELAGNLWAIHGGGFYFLEKYKVAPKTLPKHLHWFKYEAYFTWLTGFTLLSVVYYMDAKSFLIDPQVADISTLTGVMIGITTLVVGWILYDMLCSSALVKKPILFGIAGFTLLAGISYFLMQMLSARAAYIHVGALIGTLMAGNVYFIIIPAQKELVKSAVLKRPLDPTLGKKAGERSLHNNYLTLPVIFIMISNHFPSTYGHAWHWGILMVIMLASAGIKHYWNLLERGQKTRYILPVSVVALISLALVTSPLSDSLAEEVAPVPFVQVNTIIQNRCIQCHSVMPTDDQWNIAPNNVVFDTPEQIKTMADRIMVRAVRTQTMPQGNKTQMTDEEREKIKNWIMQGANIE